MKLSAPLFAPSSRELESVYRRFAKREGLDARVFARTSQWVRYDPRLGEIWCDAFGDLHAKIDLRRFRAETHAQAFPQVVGVLIAQLRGPEFRAIERYVLAGIPPVPYQDFFIAVSGFASRSVRRASEGPLRSYRRYGFYGEEVFRNKSKRLDPSGGLTEVRKETRRRVLSEIRASGGRITVDQYLAALPAGVSRRVAQLDLAGCRALEGVGSTRGRFFRARRRTR